MSTSSEDEQGSFVSYAIFNPANTDKVSAGMREELACALGEGFSAQEVAAAQSALLQELRLGRSDDAALAGALASQAYLGRTYAFSKEYEARVRAVTPKTAQAALRKYVDPAKLVIVRAGTFK